MLRPRWRRWALGLLLAVAAPACVHHPKTPSPGGAGAGAVHVVKRGETAASIAAAHQISLSDLVAANQLSRPDRIYPGQRLRIPGEGSEATTDDGPSAPAPEARGGRLARAQPLPELPPLPPVKAVPIARRCADARPAPKSLPHSERGFSWPVDGVVVGRYGNKEGLPQRGLDIGAPLGTPVWAAADGEVVFAGVQPGYGQLLILRHPGGVATVYARNAENCRRVGDKVRRGEVIARLGNGERAGSPYLYFEVREKTLAVNPRKLLP